MNYMRFVSLDKMTTLNVAVDSGSWGIVYKFLCCTVHTPQQLKNMFIKKKKKEYLLAEYRNSTC